MSVGGSRCPSVGSGSPCPWPWIGCGPVVWSLLGRCAGAPGSAVVRCVRRVWGDDRLHAEDLVGGVARGPGVVEYFRDGVFSRV